jgi:hypothetical protein
MASIDYERWSKTKKKKIYYTCCRLSCAPGGWLAASDRPCDTSHLGGGYGLFEMKFCCRRKETDCGYHLIYLKINVCSEMRVAAWNELWYSILEGLFAWKGFCCWNDSDWCVIRETSELWYLAWEVFADEERTFLTVAIDAEIHRCAKMRLAKWIKLWNPLLEGLCAWKGMCWFNGMDCEIREPSELWNWTWIGVAGE